MKYPRTYHLPWSPGVSNDDKVLHDLSSLLNTTLVVTVKMDGSNAGISRPGVQSRSGDRPVHDSFDMLKALHAEKYIMLPPDGILFGEWLYARHSIPYNKLPNYFMGFALYYEGPDVWMSWNKVKRYCEFIGVPTVPIVCFEKFDSLEQMERTLTDIAERYIKLGQEGIVVRRTGPFNTEQFSQCVAKYVRKEHVKTDKHWSRNWIPNKLNED